MKSFACSSFLLLCAALAAPAAHADPASCPNASEQLAEMLDGTMRRVGREGEVTAQFEVDAQGRVQRPTLEGLRSYRWPVRLAVEMLDCQAGTMPQRYVVSIRFIHPAQRSVEAKPPVTVAAVAAAALAASSTPR